MRSGIGDSGDTDMYIAADKELLSGEEVDFSDVCNSCSCLEELERRLWRRL
jgi:hypothetical protein